MRRVAGVAFSVFLLTLGVAADPAEPVATPAPPPPSAAPPPSEPVKSNVSFNAAITRGGKVHSGHVVRVERGIDFYGDKGWADSGLRLYVTLEQGGKESEHPWTDISTIDIKYGGRPDLDCTYESETTPWTYTCTLKTTPVVKTTDGKTWTAVSRHLWRFTFEDGTTEEFALNKSFARAQDTKETDEESAAMYVQLQAQALKDVANNVTKIVITK